VVNLLQMWNQIPTPSAMFKCGSPDFPEGLFVFICGVLFSDPVFFSPTVGRRTPPFSLESSFNRFFFPLEPLFASPGYTLSGQRGPTHLGFVLFIFLRCPVSNVTKSCFFLCIFPDTFSFLARDFFDHGTRFFALPMMTAPFSSKLAFPS